MAVQPSEIVARTKTAAVYESIKDGILTGSLPPGERLVLRELTSQFNVSAIPVREALIALERDGLVELTPHVGARVTTLSLEEAIEHRFLNAHLAPLAAASATPRFTEEDLDRMELLLERMEAAAVADESREFTEGNEAFHRALMAPCPYPKLLRFLETQWTFQRRVSALTFTTQPQMEQACIEHREIVEAARRRDALEVQLLVAGHIHRAGAAVMEYLSRTVPEAPGHEGVDGRSPSRS